MKYLIISDIHIGDGRFSCYSNLESLLLNEPYDQLILAGDLIDLFVCKAETVIKTGFFDLLGKLSETKRVVYVIGNHDYDISKYISATFPQILVTEFFKMEDGGKKFLIFHGNQVYRKRDMSFFTRLVSKINHSLWKHFKIDIQKIYTNTKLYVRYINRKRKIIIKKFGSGIDIIIVGHTHRSGYIIKDKKELYDIGSFITGNSYAIINNGKVEMGAKNE